MTTDKSKEKAFNPMDNLINQAKKKNEDIPPEGLNVKPNAYEKILAILKAGGMDSGSQEKALKAIKDVLNEQDPLSVQERENADKKKEQEKEYNERRKTELAVEKMRETQLNKPNQATGTLNKTTAEVKPDDNVDIKQDEIKAQKQIEKEDKQFTEDDTLEEDDDKGDKVHNHPIGRKK